MKLNCWMIWSCLALSIVLADVSIHWKEIRTALSARVKSRAVVKEAIPDRVIRATWFEQQKQACNRRKSRQFSAGLS